MFKTFYLIINFIFKQKDRAEILKLLIKRGANVNHLDRTHMPAINKAVINDRPECVEILLEANADPNVAFMGETPLAIAARNNRDKIVDILLRSKNTNVNHRNEQGGIPLHYACAAIVDTPSCIEQMMKHGSKINVADLKKNTPLMVTAFFNKPKIMEYLLRNGADPTPRNLENKDALEIATDMDLKDCIELLNKAGVKSQAGDAKLAADFEGKARIKN